MAVEHEPFTLVTRVTSPLTGGKCLVINDERECELLLNTLQRELHIIRTKLEEAALSQQNDQLNNVQPQAHSTAGLASHNNREAPIQFKKPSRPPLLRKRVATTTNDSTISRSAPTRRGPLPPRPPATTVTPPVTYNQQQQQHYLDIIKKKEKQLIESSNECKQLMETHIMQQVKAIDENNQKLLEKLHKRVEKERLNRIRKLLPAKQNAKPIRKGGKHSLYKSSFYETVCKEEKMKRSGQGYRLSVLSVQEEYDKRRKSSQLLPAITRTLGTHHRVDEVEPGAGPGEESNSWAITGSQAVNDHCDTPTATPQTTPTVITAIKPPEFTPIKNIFGDTHEKEKVKLYVHRKTVQKQVDQRRAMSLMYNNAQLYERITSHMMSHDVWRDLDVFTSRLNSAHDLTDDEPVMSLCLIDDRRHDNDSPSQDGTSSSSTRGTSPMTPLTPTVPLTMEQLFTNKKSSIKESVKLSTLWKNKQIT